MTNPARHVLTRYADAKGYVASCSCGWRSTRHTRELREIDANAHALEDTLTVRRQTGATQ